MFCCQILASLLLLILTILKTLVFNVLKFIIQKKEIFKIKFAITVCEQKKEK
jgi:hypothetical protein